MRRLVCLLVSAGSLFGHSVFASDLVFQSGFGNVRATISMPADGSTVGTGVPIGLAGSSTVPATLVWTSSTGGYLGTGPSIINAPLPLGAQIITLTATTAEPESALAEVSVTVVLTP
jgi:hypothetical protein